MPAKQEPRSGLNYGWNFGETGWNTGMDENLVRLGRFGFHLSVKSRTEAAPPGSPVAGDSYIVADDATGAWAGRDGAVAVWSGVSWEYGTPRIGWLAYIEDEEKLSVYKSTGWSAGVAL